MPLVRRLVVGRDEKFFARRDPKLWIARSGSGSRTILSAGVRSTLKLQLKIAWEGFRARAQADKMSAIVY